MTPTLSTTALRSSRRAGLLLACLLVPATLHAVDEPSPPLVESLSQNDLQQAIRTLLSESLGKDTLSDLAINRAALAAVLEILGPGAELLPATPPEAPVPCTNLVAPLPGGITYLRAGVFDDSFFQQIRDLPQADTGLILDLRCPGGDLDTARVSQFASLFSPPKAALFALIDAAGGEIEAFTQRPDAIQRREMTVLLVDTGTSPTAETLAAVIRFHHRKNCLIVGEPTPGRAALYEALALKNTQLRYAKAGLRLPDGTNLFNNGLLPDIAVAALPTERETILLLPDAETLTAYLTEKEKTVLNEAALMAGTNPELPELLRKSASGESSTENPSQQDPVLRQALDFLTARAFLTGYAEKKAK